MPWGARRAVVFPLALAASLGCDSPVPPGDSIKIGLMLSYTGFLAANSVNSERALVMAIDSANIAGGVAGRPLELMARDTRSDSTKVAAPAQELLAAGVAVLIGPDTHDLAKQLLGLLADRTVLFPSFATSSIDFKPGSWFVMGAPTVRVGCELMAQLRADGRTNPVVIMNPTGYNSLLAYDILNRYGLAKQVIPTDTALTTASVRSITNLSADAYLLAAFPASASSLVYALSAINALKEPARWYLSPTLHTPAFLESIPKGSLQGAGGVSSGTVAGAADFRAAFQARWHDAALDDAYPFYDAGALVVLALERAVLRTGAIPTGTGLSEHLRAVTHAGGTPVQWDQIARGISLLEKGQEIEYVGLSGTLEFDLAGTTPAPNTKWWTIDGDKFADTPAMSDCRPGN
jgi:branched-chain amino acid transport system substrate-binding protein